MTSIESATSDMETSLSTMEFTTGIDNLWVPEHGWGNEDWEAGDSPFAPQYLAALQIFAWFFGEANKCWVHLAAEMQAGKTGVINTLIRLMLITANFRKIMTVPDSIFIVTGMNDNAWKKQTKDRMPASMHKNIQHLKGLGIVSVSLERKAASRDGFKNILVIVDESHIASSVGNSPSRIIFEKMRSLSGGVENWAANNIRLITISATDPALVVGIADLGDMARVVNLRTSDAYQSVEKLKEQGRLHATFNLTREEHVCTLTDIVREKYPDTPNLYHIIRLPARSKRNMVADALENFYPGCNVIPWDSDSNARAAEEASSSDSSVVNDINEILENEPGAPTFILIKNMFYAAKTLDDTYCGILFDRNSAKDDTNLQSLLGRACGYGKSSRTHVYTSIHTVETYLSIWSQVRPRDDMVIPDVEASSLRKKMAGLDARDVDGGARMIVGPRRAIPLRGGGGGGGGGGAPPVRGERFRISDATFDTVADAKAWSRGYLIEEYKVSEIRLNHETMTFQYRGLPRAIRSNAETRQLNDLGWGISRTGAARVMPVLDDATVKYIVVFKPEFIR